MSVRGVRDGAKAHPSNKSLARLTSAMPRTAVDGGVMVPARDDVAIGAVGLLRVMNCTWYKVSGWNHALYQRPLDRAGGRDS
jgi:hypothetical protein